MGTHKVKYYPICISTRTMPRGLFIKHIYINNICTSRVTVYIGVNLLT